MGLIKSINFKGFLPEYWNITSISDNKATDKTTVIVSLYKDLATRAADPLATIATLEYILPGCDLTRADIYPVIKTINPEKLAQAPQIFFADAIDETTPPPPKQSA
ncbi:MAG: hypothetical protein NTW16_00775 [Bacteroidetes bacterium]|nr:hypothetical protein [Bacteroidota bacterium]